MPGFFFSAVPLVARALPCASVRVRLRVETEKSLNISLPLAFYSIMKMNTMYSLVAAGVLAFSGTAFASPSKTYQVTGPILEMNDSMIAVQKGKDRWEIARDSSTKATGEMKVGDKVTVTYTMAATEIEAKGPAKTMKPAASPAASPAKAMKPAASPVASPVKK